MKTLERAQRTLELAIARTARAQEALERESGRRWLVVAHERAVAHERSARTRLDRAGRHRSIDASAAPHGTRARYVGMKCRCADCKRANLDYYHARIKRRRELAGDVRPTSPATPGTLRRGGKLYQIKRCPGANGELCVRGGAWLKIGEVCTACIERATVFNGLVPVDRALAHLLKLSSAGVGYKSAAAASSCGASQLFDILQGHVTQIRAETERRILAVDVGARAGGALVSSRPMVKRIAQMERLGFTRSAIASLLGYKTPALQIGKTRKVRLANVVAVERLWRRIERGDVEVPSRFVLDRAVERVELLELASSRPGDL